MNTPHPRNRLRAEAPHLALLAALWALALLRYDAVPEAVPVHWNVDLLPDRTGGRTEAVLLLPALGTLLYGALRWLPPALGAPLYAGELAASQPAYDRLCLLVGAFLLGLSGLLHLYYAEAIGGLAPGLPALLGALLIGLGALMPGFQPNRFAGFRLPWTLADAEVWRRTHRLGGLLLALVGALLGGLGAFEPRLGLAAGLLGLLAAVLSTSIYAFAIRRR